MKIKQNLLYICLIVAIITLLFCRLFTNAINQTAIQTINFLGLIISIVTLYMELYVQYKDKTKFISFTGLFVILVIVLIAILILLAFSIVILNDRANDFISFLTLLISLPSRFYITIIFKQLFKE